MECGKGYKSSNNENWAEYVLLESKQGQTHVRKYEVLSQEVQHLKELERKPSHVKGQVTKIL